MMYSVDKPCSGAITMTLVRLQQPMMLLDSGFTVREIFPLKPVPPMRLTSEFPYAPCGIETDDGLAITEKSVTKSVSTVLFVVGPNGIPVTVTKVELMLSGVERVVLIVRMLEFPPVVGITVVGENEAVTPVGKAVPVKDNVTGLAAIVPLKNNVILDVAELPLMTLMFPELVSS